jgi:hypothetical protein
MKEAWFTFGQTHVHSVNGFTFDKDIVVHIRAHDPREVMFMYFDRKWGMEYDKEPNMDYYPRGVYDLDIT